MSRARRSARVTAIGALAFAMSVCLAAPAAADIGYVPSPNSGVTVAHLNLTARHGNIGATLTVGAGDRIIGVVIDIPAAGGTWAPKARVTLAGGLVCTGGGNTDGFARPLYTCITVVHPNNIEVHPNLAVGRYTLSLPIGRPTGTVRGMTGTVGITRPDAFSPSYDSTLVDTFPVLAPTVDQQSTAEVKNLDLGTTGIGQLYIGDVTTHVIVKPGETVTGVYLTLPTTASGIASFTARNMHTPQGIECGQDFAHTAPPATFVISCVQTYPHPAIWPAGNYSLTVRVAGIATGPAHNPDADVDLTFSGGVRRTLDTFVVTPDDFYRAPRR